MIWIIIHAVLFFAAGVVFGWHGEHVARLEQQLSDLKESYEHYLSRARQTTEEVRTTRYYPLDSTTVPIEKRVFDHAFCRRDDTSIDACAACDQPEKHHQWTTGRADIAGTFACPICGVSAPHEHTGSEIAAFRIQSVEDGGKQG